MTLPAEPENASQESQDAESLSSIRVIFWIVPLYVFAFCLLVSPLIEDKFGSVLMGVIKTKNPKLILGFFSLCLLCFVSLIGVAIRSIECAFILSSNPLRAFGMGRYVILVYWIVGFPMNAWYSLPTSKIEAPLESVIEVNDSNCIIDANQMTVYETNIFWWFGFGADAMKEFCTISCLYFFSCVAYEKLLKDGKRYEFEHFIYDVSFGWKGNAY